MDKMQSPKAEKQESVGNNSCWTMRNGKIHFRAKL